MKHILYCQPSFWWQPHHVRFVKAKKDGWNGPNEYTSSSELRAAMSSTQRGDDLKTSLEKMALSPHILWQCRAHWRPQAKARKNDLITLDPLDEWDTEVLEAEALKEEEVSQLELARSSEMEGNQEKYFLFFPVYHANVELTVPVDILTTLLMFLSKISRANSGLC